MEGGIDLDEIITKLLSAKDKKTTFKEVNLLES
jgi:serine/threonine-protein phosphatase PP1 catalytic subunit